VYFKFLIWLFSGDKPSYKHFPAVGAFSIFCIFPQIFNSGETADQVKKSQAGAKMGRTSSITMPRYGGDRGSDAGCRPSVMLFLFVCRVFE